MQTRVDYLTPSKLWEQAHFMQKMNLLSLPSLSLSWLSMFYMLAKSIPHVKYHNTL